MYVCMYVCLAAYSSMMDLLRGASDKVKRIDDAAA